MHWHHFQYEPSELKGLGTSVPRLETNLWLAKQRLLLKSRNSWIITQFSLTDVRPVGSIYDEVRILTNFLFWKTHSVWWYCCTCCEKPTFLACWCYCSNSFFYIMKDHFKKLGFFWSPCTMCSLFQKAGCCFKGNILHWFLCSCFHLKSILKPQHCFTLIHLSSPSLHNLLKRAF